MTPEQKAKDLVNQKYYQRLTLHLNVNNNSKQMWAYAKICAHIVVDEIIQLLDTLHKPEYTSFIAKEIYTISDTEYDNHIHGYELMTYWNEVKKQIDLC